MGRFLYLATPFFLLGLAGLVLFEPWLPFRARVVEMFGETGVLRFAVAMLCFLVMLQWTELARLQVTFRQLLGELREFRGSAAGRGGGGADAGPQREAVALLIGALRSPDPAVRESSAVHLARLTGQDFGEQVEAWEKWAADQS